MHEFPPLLNACYLTGATATGKSRIGLALAEAVGAEIISLDSMAVYQGMDIGTAKVSLEDQQRIPHHLLDVVAPNESFSLSEYVAAAHKAARQIESRGKTVLFVGGTPLYLKALLRGVCEGPPADQGFREQVEEEVERIGLEALRTRLEQVDPLSAMKLHPNDKRRMIRALEVYTLTGVPMSHYQKHFDETGEQRCQSVFVLGWDRAELHERINDRVDKMFERGFPEEVARLVSQYGSLSDTAIQGVGYREVLAYLRGEQDLATTLEQTKIRTRKFARRQETWFRGLEECQWVPVNDSTLDTDLVDQLRERQAGSR